MGRAVMVRGALRPVPEEQPRAPGHESQKGTTQAPEAHREGAVRGSASVRRGSEAPAG
jgi:hypothetical protein